MQIIDRTFNKSLVRSEDVLRCGTGVKTLRGDSYPASSLFYCYSRSRRRNLWNQISVRWDLYSQPAVATPQSPRLAPGKWSLGGVRRTRALDLILSFFIIQVDLDVKSWRARGEGERGEREREREELFVHEARPYGDPINWQTWTCMCVWIQLFWSEKRAIA